ncbi:ORC-CDC6 family AAA ATPase, partial [Enterobacter bugandensis]
VSDLLHERLFTLCNWINAPVTETPPFSLDTKFSLQNIISKLHAITGCIIKPNFQVYIDEFENLTSDQQAIINTLMKHGSMPLLFSVAYKKNANISHKTLDNESIVEQHDFRYIDLEELYLNDFDTFAGEILA